MYDIFVNYRNADARFGAAATYELLVKRFGKERVFLDNQSIGPGSFYPEELYAALESMRVLLVFIGPEWLAHDPQSPGRFLIERQADWVRREIKRAFERAVPVVPVLLDGARLPADDVLPGDVRPLLHCQTVEIRSPYLGADVDRLADLLFDLLIDASPPPPPPRIKRRSWSRVREIDDPIPLGVQPSPRLPEASVVLPADPLMRVPDYVPRDATDQLEWAMANTPFVLVVGDAAAGKSRLAYEVVRRTLPDHWFVMPRGVEDLAHTIAWAEHTGNCVLWLDDIEKYLGPAGLTVDSVVELTKRRVGDVVLVGTIRSQEHAHLSPRWEARIADEPDRLRLRLRRDVIRLAYEIHLPRRWSEAEVLRASASADPRVAHAAWHAHEFGIAEYLAAGPQLLAEWRDAWAPGGHPRAAALVAAAVDAVRVGVRHGIGVDMLRRLHGEYLKARGGTSLRPESFDEALSWATETLHATSSLLVPTDRRRFLPFAYLVDAIDTQPKPIAVPERTWQVLITRMPATECWHIGEAAYGRRHLKFAQSAFRRAIAAGNRSAELRLADAIGEAGDRQGALATLAAVVEARTRSAGRQHADTVEARLALAGWTGRAGDPRAAAHLIGEIVADLVATVGPTHADTLTTRHAFAHWLGRAGRLSDAVAEFRRLVGDRTRQDGPNHPHTLTARHDLANWLGRTGNKQESLREHERIAVARRHALGPDHPETLRSRHRLARLVCEVHGTKAGLPQLDEVVTDRTRVLGADHPDTLRTRSQYARWTGKGGNPAEAAALFAQLAMDSAQSLGAEHPDTLRARHQHARWTSEAGDHQYAVTLLREVIGDWTRLLGARHPYTLISRYRLTRATAGSGAWLEATNMLADLLADDITVLGDHHPYTRHAQELLARWQTTPKQ